jgi:AraC-like DNA-binding protein
MNDVGSVIAGGGIFLGLTLAVFLVRQGGTATRLLAAAMVFAVLNILHGRIFSAAAAGHARLLMEPLQFALPPLFAGYVRALLMPAWRPAPRDLLHFFPVLLTGGAAIVLTAVPPDGRSSTAPVVFWLLLLVQALLYVGRAVRRLRSYRLALRNAVSTLDGIDQSWLLWYSCSLHILYLSYAVVPAILVHAGNPEAARHLVGFSLCLVVGVLATHQLLQRRAPVALPPDDPVGGITAAAPTAPAWDPLLPDALVTAMEGRGLFRNPGLGLIDLAEAVGWPRNEVSAAINGHFGLSFHDFVNNYRVAEAQRLMLDPARRGHTLLALGMEAGFNSKPTFNAVFKKTTGLSPSAWLAREKV